MVNQTTPLGSLSARLHQRAYGVHCAYEFKERSERIYRLSLILLFVNVMVVTTTKVGSNHQCLTVSQVFS